MIGGKSYKECPIRRNPTGLIHFLGFTVTAREQLAEQRSLALAYTSTADHAKPYPDELVENLLVPSALCTVYLGLDRRD
jgi:hypothetical protein